MRSARLIPLSEFKARAGQPNVLILDARSAQAFAEGHIAGAVNLPLPDFTAESLAQVIGANPDRETFMAMAIKMSGNWVKRLTWMTLWLAG